MQERESEPRARTPLEQLLGRHDEAAHVWLAERLVAGDDIDPAEQPQASGTDRVSAEAAG